MSVSTIARAYKGEVEISGVQINSYSELKDKLEDNSNSMSEVKNKIRQICACTPKDMFPEDSEGSTLWKLNNELDELFEYLSELEWDRARLMTLQTIVDDWQYTGKTDPYKKWRKICPDMYEDLRRDLAETMASMDGNPETFKKMQEETKQVNEEIRKKLEENEKKDNQ